MLSLITQMISEISEYKLKECHNMLFICKKDQIYQTEPFKFFA